MDDYIFLIIAIALSIFGAINKSRKAKMEAQSPEVKAQAQAEATKRRNHFMDQLLGEDFLQEEEEITAPPVRVKPAASKVAFKSSSETMKGLNYQLPRFKSTLPDRPKHKIIASSQRIKTEAEPFVEQEETPSYLEDFSLRKAVVYSIILEPKY